MSYQTERIRIYTDSDINQVAKEFDYDQVAQVMELLGWKWAHCHNTSGIPDKHAIRSAVYEKLRAVAASPLAICETFSGGLKATKTNDCLSIEFVLCYSQLYE